LPLYITVIRYPANGAQTIKINSTEGRKRKHPDKVSKQFLRLGFCLVIWIPTLSKFWLIIMKFDFSSRGTNLVPKLLFEITQILCGAYLFWKLYRSNILAIYSVVIILWYGFIKYRDRGQFCHYWLFKNFLGLKNSI
jgi:hypothetical protein